MGVNPTLPNYKTLTFDGSNSAQYGVYLTGEAVFNAPERAVEMVSIPGRNGAFALDKGHFGNIEVTYKAGIFADTQADFANAISNFRNMLCSKVGYCRLTDDYNPNEYRMAVYKSGLEVKHEGLLTGEFDIIFDCKPQRFLTSGETKTTVVSGGKLTNPTLFASRPQLQVYGYGTINLGSQVVGVENVPIGEVQVASAFGSTRTENKGVAFNRQYSIAADFSSLDTGDNFTVSGTEIRITYTSDISFTPSQSSLGTQTNCTASLSFPTNAEAYTSIIIDDATFAKGTSSSLNWSAHISLYRNGTVYDKLINGSIDYTNGQSSIKYVIAAGDLADATIKVQSRFPDVFGVSTKSALGTPIYIDLDVGEAYNIIGGSAVSVNNAVQLPAELPTLPSGETTITFDNTVTKLDIVPRWWKV